MRIDLIVRAVASRKNFNGLFNTLGGSTKFGMSGFNRCRETNINV